MKLKKYLFALFFISNVVSADLDPYLILSLQGTTGQNDLKSSSSLLANIGLGYETNFGIYFDWVLGVNSEAIADVIPDERFIDDNQQIGQMDLVTGYKLSVSKRSYLKLGIGIESAIFADNCAYNYAEGRTICDKKYEHGPTYKVGFYFSPSSKTMFGLEFNRDELSAIRKYNGLSVVVNGKF